MVNTIPIAWMWDVFDFWYLGFIIWILLVASIIVFIMAVVKVSWKVMLTSVLIFLPNVVGLIIYEYEKIIYILFLFWFITQIIMLIKIFRIKKNAF